MSGATIARTRRAVPMLYGLAAALLLLGLALGRYDSARRNRIPLPVRMLSSALVLACALLNWKGTGVRSERSARLTAYGMGCGLLGDLVMAEVIPLPAHVAFGMLSFGAGHVLYMRAFLDRSRSLARPAGCARWLALGLAGMLGLTGWWALARNPARRTSRGEAALQYGALVYSLLLSSMSGLAVSLAVQERRCARLALGGALFLASDMVLASELFRQTHFPGIGDVIWLTYIAGQALIVGTPGADR